MNAIEVVWCADWATKAWRPARGGACEIYRCLSAHMHTHIFNIRDAVEEGIHSLPSATGAPNGGPCSMDPD